jgi:hypothetical protein
MKLYMEYRPNCKLLGIQLGAFDHHDERKINEIPIVFQGQRSCCNISYQENLIGILQTKIGVRNIKLGT